MKRPSQLNKKQLEKFIEGFNLLINHQDTSKARGYKLDGIEFARTLVLDAQLNNVVNAHSSIGLVDKTTDFKSLEEAWLKAAGNFGYADLLS